MTFGESLKEVVAGKKVRREEWDDDGTYLAMAENKLMIFKPEDEKLHPLIVSTEDIKGDDWVSISGGM